MSNAWEISREDIEAVCRAHDTVLTEEQLEEVFGDIDADLVESAVLNYDDFDDQCQAALAEIEEQMILGGMYITDPKKFLMP